MVNTRNTARPSDVNPIAFKRFSRTECCGSGSIAIGPANRSSMAAIETPCFRHFSRFPASTYRITNVYTNAIRRRLLRRLRRRREEPVLGPRQAEVFAQGLALVLGAVDAAALQLGHDQIDEVVEPAR